MSRIRNVAKDNQLSFMFDGSFGIQTKLEMECENWLKDKNVRLVSNDKNRLMKMLQERYCYGFKKENTYKDNTIDENLKLENEEEENEDWLKERYYTLKVMQSQDLDFKIEKALQVLDDAAEKFGINSIILAYSAGKDSEVLSHIVKNIWKKRITHVFSNTTCEFPETLERVYEKSKEEDTDIIMVSPDMTFKQVVQKYGFPMISKNISKSIRIYRNAKTESTSLKIKDYMERRETKWVDALDCPFSETCCEKLKKMPMRRFQNAFGYKCAIVGTLADESRQRTKEWISVGCTNFDSNQPKCMPLSIWTEEDIYEYARRYNVKLNRLYTEFGYSRNGCLYCGYGAHLASEKDNRFKMLANTHPHARKVFERHFSKYFDMMQDLGYKGFEY